MSLPRMMPVTYDKLVLNTDPNRNLRYNSLKLDWKFSTKWARESYIAGVVSLYNELGLHGRLFADKDDARDQIQSSLMWTFGNRNLK